jgi:hypothetical protein
LSEAADLVDEGGLAEVIRHAFASSAIAPGSRRHARWPLSARYSSNRSLLGSKSP